MHKWQTETDTDCAFAPKCRQPPRNSALAHKVTEDDSCYYLHPNTFLINIPAIPDLCYYCPKTDHQIKVKKKKIVVSLLMCAETEKSQENQASFVLCDSQAISVKHH